MSWTLAIIAVVLLIAVWYARRHSIEWTGFGQRFLPTAKRLVDDLKEGARGVAIAPCEACGYEGADRTFRHVSGLYLCDDCRVSDSGFPI